MKINNKQKKIQILLYKIKRAKQQARNIKNSIEL